MSVFKTKCFFFLRNPRGGVEDLDRMQAAGFDGVFCNIGDHYPSEWQTIRGRAGARGMFCGPWARTEDSGSFSEEILERILACADMWDSPLIVNSESELKGSGDKWTKLIAERCAGYDAALSMEPQPFDNVEWWPLKDMPVLPQIFPPAGSPAPDDCIEMWHAYGVDCVYLTFASYGGCTPSDFDLNAPYSIYTADDCGGNYAAWSPRRNSFEGCVDSGGGTPMPAIGSQDGIVAAVNRFRDLDPAGTLLVKQGNKWPDISTLPSDLSKWKAYDKLQRTLQILKDDHDAA